MKKAKRNFHKELLREHKFSPRRFWNAIKSIFPTKSNSSTHKSSDMKKRVNEFENYFANIVSKMKSASFSFIKFINFVWRYHKKEPLRTKSIFTFSFVSTASETDSLPSNLLKDCANAITNHT